jgi:hypothetical protein
MPHGILHLPWPVIGVIRHCIAHDVSSQVENKVFGSRRACQAGAFLRLLLSHALVVVQQAARQ